MTYVTSKDIVIPAGTTLAPAPARVDRCDKDGRPALATGNATHFVEAIMGPTRDTTFSWTMHIDDALEAGLIEEAELVRRCGGSLAE